MEVYHHPFLTSALDRGEWSVSRPDRFTREERAAVPIELESWVVPRARVDVLEKMKLSLARIRL